MQRCVAVREVPERCLTNYNLAVSALCRAHRAQRRYKHASPARMQHAHLAPANRSTYSAFCKEYAHSQPTVSLV